MKLAAMLASWFESPGTGSRHGGIRVAGSFPAGRISRRGAQTSMNEELPAFLSCCSFSAALRAPTRKYTEGKRMEQMSDIRREIDGLEAAAVSSETWDLSVHGKCRYSYFHEGKMPPDFDATLIFDGDPAHG